MRRGGNVFITGSAGTGKSQVTRALLKAWDAEFGGYEGAAVESGCVALTATTGIAAVNLGMSARTFYSALKITGYDVDAYSGMALAARYKQFGWKVKVLTQLQKLVIDEASMLAGPTLDTLETLLRVLRCNDAPFGGVQVVLVGDVCQLPPVPPRSADRDAPPLHVFLANAYVFGRFKAAVLTETFRQTDPVFVELLGRVRVGAATPADVALLNTRVGACVDRLGVKPTLLYCVNKDVNAENAMRLRECAGPSAFFAARSAATLQGAAAKRKKEDREKTLAQLIGVAWQLAADSRVGTTVPREAAVAGAAEGARIAGGRGGALSVVELRVGAQVQFAANMDLKRGLCNGTRGVVVAFMTVAEWNARSASASALTASSVSAPTASFAPNALTASGSATGTFEAAERLEVDAEEAFYQWPGGSSGAVDAFFYPSGPLPVVRFLVPPPLGSASTALEPCELLVPFWRWTRAEKDMGEAAVSQLPLRLAWATTIHGSQSQTLSLVRVALEGVFVAGQAYSALSRATTLDGLSLVTPVQARQLRADPECVAFSTAVSAIDAAAAAAAAAGSGPSSSSRLGSGHGAMTASSGSP